MKGAILIRAGARTKSSLGLGVNPMCSTELLGMDHRVGTIVEGPSVTCSFPFHQDLIFAAIQDMMLVSIHVHSLSFTQF